MRESAPAWSAGCLNRARREKLVLVKVFIQGHHAGKGSYGSSFVCTHRDAVILAAVVNNIGQLTDQQRERLEQIFNLDPEKV